MTLVTGNGLKPLAHWYEGGSTGHAITRFIYAASSFERARSFTGLNGRTEGLRQDHTREYLGDEKAAEKPAEYRGSATRLWQAIEP